MFDVGFAELFLLSLIGLLVLGPERLPAVARTVGGFVRKARASWTSLRSTIEAEMAEADIAEPLNKAKEEFRQIGKDLTDVPGFTAEKKERDSSDNTPDAAGTDTPSSTQPSESGKQE